MTRPLEAATNTALGQAELPLATILYLDILDDPLFAWTGIGDLVFAAGQTGDASLDGKTFKGIGTIAEIGTISEGVGGSDALEITLPGVDPFEPMMRQVITNRNRWQFRRAIVWMMALDPVTFAIAGKPFRIKTGRIDKMPFGEQNDVGHVKCRIEGQQSYGGEPLNSKWVEQIDINVADKSQKWVHALANISPEMGVKSATGSGTGTGGGGSPIGYVIDFVNGGGIGGSYNNEINVV